MAPNQYDVQMFMKCKDCSGAIEKVIERMKEKDGAEISKYHIDTNYPDQNGIVHIEGSESLKSEYVVAKLKKSQKAVYWAKHNGDTLAV